MTSFSLDPFLYLSVLVLISFIGYLNAKNLHKRLVFSFTLIFSAVALVDIKISSVSSLTVGINILVYVVPLLVVFVLIFEQFQKNLKG